MISWYKRVFKSLASAVLLLYVYFVPLASGPPDFSGEVGNDSGSKVEGSGDNRVKAGKRNCVFIEHLLKTRL